MQILQTHPRISEKDVIDLSNRVKQFNTPFIDGQILSALIKASYYCGLKKSELLELNIGNILDKKGDIHWSFLNNVPVTDNIRAIFLEHLAHLKARGYCRIKSAPLFPNKKRKRYGSRQLQYDLEKCMKEFVQDIGLEKIRQSGICRFYDGEKAEGRSARQCLEETMQFTRGKTLRHVEGILKNKIIPAGKKKYIFGEYYKIIEKIDCDDIKPTGEDILVYETQIKNEAKLTAKEKFLLIEELHRVSNTQKA